jgi:DNA-binding response OmpR family regulator
MKETFKNNLDRKSILVIEDDQELARSTVEILSREGFFTLSVDNVTDAIKKLENQKFHLVIADMHLGSQTGEKIIHVIRKDLCGLNIRTPILVCSGQLKPKMFDNIKFYIDDVIIKPFKIADLTAKAKHWTNVLSNKDPSNKLLSDQRYHLLVIDDNAELVDNICSYLSSDGTFLPVPSYNLTDTQLKISRQKFDCILIDRHIRQKECTEIIKSLRLETGAPNNKTPVIIMTGDLSEDFINLLRDDVQGFVRKPVALKELANVISFAINSSSQEF